MYCYVVYVVRPCFLDTDGQRKEEKENKKDWLPDWLHMLERTITVEDEIREPQYERKIDFKGEPDLRPVRGGRGGGGGGGGGLSDQRCNLQCVGVAGENSKYVVVRLGELKRGE
ncbi:hypothetical protein NQZ68_028641 [Dissostichus eleginoides]|nr:hypothetical protein NQZ68_028641 [Dissostichus eleginoides]